jgi:GlpG protein
MSTVNHNRWRLAVITNPMVSLLILGSVMGALLVEFSFPFPEYLLYSGLEQGQYMRLVTPIFLHFGLMHLAFNSIWLAMLGTRIERQQGALHLLLVVIVCGAVSNMVQFNWSGSKFFGGMSGVIYALLGYLWVKHKLRPVNNEPLPSGIMLFMVGWLLFCMTGVLELTVGIAVANAAHLSGLISGLVMGAIFTLLSTTKHQG